MIKFIRSRFVKWRKRLGHVLTSKDVDSLVFFLVIAGVWLTCRLFSACDTHTPLTVAKPTVASLATHLVQTQNQLWDIMFDICLIKWFILAITILTALFLLEDYAVPQVFTCFFWVFWWAYVGGMFCWHSSDHSGGWFYIIVSGVSSLCVRGLCVRWDEEAEARGGVDVLSVLAYWVRPRGRNTA